MKRDERAAHNLEGGLMTPLEGLANSRRPCARVLSVAGFLAIIGRFPGSGWFILRREEALFAPQDPLSFNPTVKRVLGTGAWYRAVWYGVYIRVYIRGVHTGYTYQGVPGRHIAQYTSLLRYPGGI